MKATLGLAALIGALLPAASYAETMTNDTVLTLAKAGLGETLIIDKVNSESCGYDVSTPGIISLKKAGLSDNIVSAMVRRCTTLAGVRGLAGDDSSPDPKVKHSPGIYVMQSWSSPASLQVLRPSKSSGMKTSGNGSIVFPLISKLVVSGPQSHVAVPANAPVFYFYFNVSDNKVSDFGVENSIAAQSPEEFSLVKFRQKPDEREIEVGRVSAYGGSLVSMKKGIDPRITIKFDIEDQGNGIFKVSLSKSLDAGEYAFVFTGANGASRIYDFSIAAASSTATIKPAT